MFTVSTQILLPKQKRKKKKKTIITDWVQL